MKVFIFAAGKGVRMQPLTNDRPKPLLEVAGRPLLDRILEVLPDVTSEIFVIVGYKGDMIREHLGSSWCGKKITYIEQAEALGTGHALGLCRPYLAEGEKFLVLYADDLRDKASLDRACRREHAILVKELEDTLRFGTVLVDADKRIIGLEEKSPNPKSHLVVTGAYVLTTKIFDYVSALEPNGEYYINSMLIELFKHAEVYAEEQDFWFPIGFPEDLAAAADTLNKNAA